MSTQEKTPVERAYDEMVATFRDRSYVIQPSEHVGHVVTIDEAEPVDIGALRAHCSCGATWALDRFGCERAFARHIEVKGPGRIG
jgi:hypothetical protein